MTATTLPASSRKPVRPPGPHRRVELRWLAMFVLAVLAATALALWGLQRAAERASVVVVRAPVAAGQAIPETALGTADVAADDPSVTLVPASQLDDVVGLTAARALLAGTLLAPGDVSTEPPIRSGERSVGALLAPGRFPRTLSAGDRVLALPGGLPDAEPITVRLLAADTRGEKLDVVMVAPADQAGALARWAASDDLVLVGEGG